MREFPAFGTTNGWDVISVLDDEEHNANVSFASSAFHNDAANNVTPPTSPRVPPPPSSPGAVGDTSVLLLGHQGDVESEHVSSVFCTSNGRVSLRPVVDLGTPLDPLSLTHSMAGVTQRRPLKYPYSAKGLPTTQDVAAAVMRTNCEVTVDGCVLKRCVRRRHVLHMDTGIVSMDATFANEPDMSQLACSGSGAHGDPCSDKPFAHISTRRFASLVDNDTAVLEVTVKLERHHGSALKSYPVSFAIESLIDDDMWRVISSTSCATTEDETDPAVSEETSQIKAVLSAGEGPHAVVESRITVGCVKACGNASVTSQRCSSSSTTPHQVVHKDPTRYDLGSGASQTSASAKERLTPVGRWVVKERKVVEGTLVADGVSHLTVYAIFRHRRRQSESATEPNVIPWSWANESTDHDPVMLEEAHKTAVQQFWRCGTTSATIAPSVTTQVSDASSPHRYTAALRFSVYTILANASGVGAGFPLTSCGLTSDDLGGLCNLSHVVLHGGLLVRTAPWLAKHYLLSIIAMLPNARINAQNQNITGALFPAQTIDGADCVPYFVNSAPRIHVSCDVALFALTYLRVCTENGLASLADDFGFQVGVAQLVFETALAVLDFGEFDAAAGEFRLDGVTGPDEYNPLVDDHFYTLVVARAHLREVARLLEPGAPIYDDDLLMTAFQVNCLGELYSDAKLCSSCIVIRRDDATKAYLAHPCFDTLPEFPQNEFFDRFPLSAGVHPLVIYKHRVVQTPEVILAMLRQRHEFAFEDLCTTTDYYKPCYTRDVNWALGLEAAADLVTRGDLTPSTDLLEALLAGSLDQNLTESAKGLRLAPMSSAWAAITMGLIGLHEMPNGELAVNPALPLGWKSVTMPLHHRGTWFKVTVLPRDVAYEHVSGPAVRLRHGKNATPVFLSSKHAARRVPRPVASEVRPAFDGAVVLLDAIVEDFHELNFRAWRTVLDEYFAIVKDRHVESPSCSRARSAHSTPLLSNHASVDDLSSTQIVASPPATSEEFNNCALPSLTLREYTDTFLGAQQQGGQLQYSGLEVVLRNRGIELPLGTASDAAVVASRFGLANAKLLELKTLISDSQLNFIPGVEALLKSCHDAGLRVAIITFSRSADDLFSQLPDIRPWVSSVINGVEARAMRVKGRPHADLFMAAAERLHVLPSRCFVLGSELERGFYPKAFDGFAAAVNVLWSPEEAESRGDGGMQRVDTLPPCVLTDGVAAGSQTQPPSPSSRCSALVDDSRIISISSRQMPSSIDEMERLTHCD